MQSCSDVKWCCHDGGEGFIACDLPCQEDLMKSGSELKVESAANSEFCH